MSRILIHDHSNIHQGGKIRATHLAGFDFDAVTGPGVGTTTTDLPWFDVQVDGTCVGDGSTDDTVALQSAIDVATNNGTQSATLYFPPGTYLIGGALQDTGARNAQILLPTVSTSDPQITIRFVGAARPPLAVIGPIPTPSGYSIIKSTLTGGSGSAACISGGNQVFTSLNNIQVNVVDLICLVPSNPSFTFWNLSATQGGGASGVFVCTVTDWVGTRVQPTNAGACGLRMPNRGHSNYTYVDGIAVAGFYTGIQLGELTIAKGIANAFCINGVELISAPHPTLIMEMHQTACQNGITVTPGSFPISCDVLLYNAEHFSSPAWAVTAYDLNDGSDAMLGHIRWVTYTFTAVADGFTVNGGANTTNVEVGPLSTSGPAGGDLSGTYPNPTVPHITDATDAHDASAVSFDPTGTGLSASDVQGAIEEVVSGGGGDSFVVDPGAPTYDDSDPDEVVVTVVAKFGIDVGPYFNSAGVASGDEAALMRDPVTGS